MRERDVRPVAAAAVVACLLGGPSAAMARQAAGAKPAPARPAATAKPKSGAQAPKKTTESAALDTVKKAADKARTENRLDDAVALYFKGVQMQPDWAEGWWYLGMISYDQDRPQPARDALKRFTALVPNDARGWGVMGLAEVQLKDYDQALAHLQQARQLGLRSGTDIGPPVGYYTAVLLSRVGLPDQAIQVLNEFAVEGDDSPKVIEAFGVATLRLPMLPTEVPGEQRDAVMMAGRAQYFSAARLLPAAKQAFEQLVTRYPDFPNAHYAFGVFLLGEEPDQGVDELKKELKITPGHSLAMLSLAFEYLRRSEFETAKEWASKVVAVDPGNFVGHKALGQTLIEMGDMPGAIKELETAVNIAPTSPTVRFQLAKAYQKAGRTADAERERAEFSRLDREYRTAKAGAQSVGGEETPAAAAPPQSPNQRD